MKSLFDERTFSYSEDAQKIDRQIYSAVVPIFETWCIQCGYSPREVSHILQSTIEEVESVVILRRSRKNKNCNQPVKPVEEKG